MPKYEYACKSCGEHIEVVQSFTDDSLTECPSCGGVLRKVFGNIGVVLKGSGFYKTDNRSSSDAGKASRSESGGSKESKSNDKAADTSSSDGGSSDKGSSDKGSSEKGSAGTGSSDKSSVPSPASGSDSKRGSKSDTGRPAAPPAAKTA